jgi:hypothetical protein
VKLIPGMSVNIPKEGRKEGGKEGRAQLDDVGI